MFCNNTTRSTIDPQNHHGDVLRGLYKDYGLLEMEVITDKADIAPFDVAMYLKGRKSHITDGMGMPLERDDIWADLDVYGKSTVLIWSYPVHRHNCNTAP